MAREVHASLDESRHNICRISLGNVMSIFENFSALTKVRLIYRRCIKPSPH